MRSKEHEVKANRTVAFSKLKFLLSEDKMPPPRVLIHLPSRLSPTSSQRFLHKILATARSYAYQAYQNILPCRGRKRAICQVVLDRFPRHVQCTRCAPNRS